MTMTYYGSTAPSTSANPPVQLHSVIGGKIQHPGDLSTAPTGGQLWFYASTNAVADVVGVGVFTDGGALGMVNGDHLFGKLISSANTTSILQYQGTLVSTNGIAFQLATNYTT